MNAIPPKGQMPGAGRKDAAQDDHIHLTMSFEDELEAGPADAAEVEDAAGREAAEPPRRRTAEAVVDEADATAAGGHAGKTQRGGLLQQFAQIELSLTVEVGSVGIALKDLMAVEPGQLLALDRMTSEPVSVLVNGQPFARGEIVAVGDRYGVRLLEIVSAAGGAG
jgi:flagellar motor switch protein FliN/FliY